MVIIGLNEHSIVFFPCIAHSFNDVETTFIQIIVYI